MPQALFKVNRDKNVGAMVRSKGAVVATEAAVDSTEASTEAATEVVNREVVTRNSTEAGRSGKTGPVHTLEEKDSTPIRKASKVPQQSLMTKTLTAISA